MQNVANFPAKSKKNSTKKKKSEIHFSFEKKWWRFWLKFWDLSGAKACKFCRSRQELSNEYLLAKIGVDTAENEPLKVWRKFCIWREICRVKNPGQIPWNWNLKCEARRHARAEQRHRRGRGGRSLRAAGENRRPRPWLGSGPWANFLSNSLKSITALSHTNNQNCYSEKI